MKTTLCPNGKVLAGSWFCPCHGLARTASGQLSKMSHPRAPHGPSRASESRLGTYHQSIDARRQREGDEMSEALVAILQRIRAHELKRFNRSIA